MNVRDIRCGDLVKFRSNLTDKSKELIIKFSRRISKQNEMRSYAADLTNGHFTFKVKECERTPKKQIEYAILISSDGVQVPVQTRYLVLINRKAKHPLTNIFQDIN